MRAPVRVLDGRGMIVVVVVVLGQMDMRRRQDRGKQHGCNKQRRGDGPSHPGGNHTRIILRLAVQRKDMVEPESLRKLSSGT